MLVLSLDFETFSELDITKVGAYRYAEHPSTEALMLGWAIDDSPVQLWSIAEGEPMPSALLDALARCDTIIRAFNANFERLILRHQLNYRLLRIEQFRCTMVQAYGLSFTRGLDDVITQFNLAVQKDSRGKALIRRFSQPQPKNQKVARWTHLNDPEGWAEFKAYCVKDVEAERNLLKHLEPYGYPEIEWSYYHMDQRINDRGVPIDRALVDAALQINDTERADLIAQMKELTGLDNPNSGPQLLGWLKEQGLELPDMKKETVAAEIARFAAEDFYTDAANALLLKQQLAKTSVTKWKAMDRAICDDDCLHGMFQFAGASRTQRWAGRLVQLQNLARGGNTTKDPETLAEYMLIKED